MKIKKLISVFCALIMIVTCVQIPAFAASYAIDLSENKTRFTGSEVQSGTIEIHLVTDSQRDHEPADNTNFIFESSNEDVVTVDEFGNYTITGTPGASIITVSMKNNTSTKRSMLFYCGGEDADYLDVNNFDTYFTDEFPNDVVQNKGWAQYLPTSDKDEFIDDSYEKTHFPKYIKKKEIWRNGEDGERKTVLAMVPVYGVAPKNGTTLNSFVLTSWQFDNATGAGRPRLGVGSTKLENGFYYGRNSTNSDSGNKVLAWNKGTAITLNSLNPITGKETTREKGWHQMILVVNRDDAAGLTTIKYFYDGELVFHGTTTSKVTPKTIQMTTHYVNFDKASSTYYYTASGLFQEWHLAPLVGAETFESYGLDVYEADDNVDTERSFSIEFNKNLDTEKSTVDATLTEVATGETIAVDKVFDGKFYTITPQYPLMPGREYSLAITGKAINEAGILDVATEIDCESVVNFTTAKESLYAENPSLEENVESGKLSLNAELVGIGAGHLVLSQFDENGIMRTASAKAISGEALETDKEETAVSYEAYVWSAINSENIRPLYDGVAKLGDDYLRTYGDTLESSDESDFISNYDVENDKVDIKITSKIKRKGLPVIVRVVYPGMNIADATADNFNEIYARAEQLETQEGGVLEYSFKLDSSIAGQYKILVNMPFEDEVLESSIKYVSEEAVNEAIALVQNSTSENIEENFEAARELIDIDYREYDSIEHQSTVLAMLAKAENCESLSEFATLFETFTGVVKILEDNDLEKIKENKDAWGIDTEGDESLYEMFCDIESESERESIIDDIFEIGFNSIESAPAEGIAVFSLRSAPAEENTALREAFFDATTVYFISGMMNYSELFPFIEKINDILELDLPASEPTDAMTYLSENLDGIDGVSALKAKYEEAITEKGDGTEGEGEGEGSGSSGGNSGSSSGGGNGGGGLSGGSGSGLTTDVGGDYVVKPDEVAGSETPQWVLDELELKNRKVFNDIESVPWAEDSIRELYNLGIISGKGEGIFAPNDYITREEAAKILILMAGIDTSAVTAENPFADVDSSAWYAPYVAAAFANKIVNGTSQTTFGTGAYITREELCTLADRAATASDIFLDDEFTIFPFDDEAQISPWALNSVLKMRESFIVTGMGGNVFNPKAPVTRAQAAKIIYGVIAYAAQ